MNTNGISDLLLAKESLKVSRDLKNVINTAFDDGKVAGKVEGRLEEKTENIKTTLIRNSLSLEEIVEDFDTTVEFVNQIKQRYNL
jgi:predicted transposase YdaD